MSRAAEALEAQLIAGAGLAAGACAFMALPPGGGGKSCSSISNVFSPFVADCPVPATFAVSPGSSSASLPSVSTFCDVAGLSPRYRGFCAGCDGGPRPQGTQLWGSAAVTVADPWLCAGTVAAGSSGARSGSSACITLTAAQALRWLPPPEGATAVIAIVDASIRIDGFPPHPRRCLSRSRRPHAPAAPRWPLQSGR